jgi:hypothetical protein
MNGEIRSASHLARGHEKQTRNSWKSLSEKNKKSNPDLTNCDRITIARIIYYWYNALRPAPPFIKARRREGYDDLDAGWLL